MNCRTLGASVRIGNVPLRVALCTEKEMLEHSLLGRVKSTFAEICLISSKLCAAQIDLQSVFRDSDEVNSRRVALKKRYSNIVSWDIKSISHRNRYLSYREFFKYFFLGVARGNYFDCTER